jgi:hypothetical protein
MASAVLFDRQPFARIVRCRTVAKVLSIGFEGPEVFPVLGGEIVECEPGLGDPLAPKPPPPEPFRCHQNSAIAPGIIC